MKSKNLFLLIIFGLFFLLFPILVMATCCGALSISASGGGTCIISAHMCADGCPNGTLWNIKDSGGTTMCSGTVINPGVGFYEHDCSWTVTTGAYTYVLNISNVERDSGYLICPEAKPKISFMPSSFTFTAIEGGSNPADQTLNIWNSGTTGTTLNWSVSEGANWLSLAPSSGSSTGNSDIDNVTLSVDISGLSAGTYTATITISDQDASNGPQTVPVRLAVGFNGPSVSTDAATDITQTSATLNGTLDGLGYNSASCLSCSCIVWFEYRKSTDVTWTEVCKETKTSTGSFSCFLSGLTPDTTYIFKAFAKNGGSL